MHEVITLSAGCFWCIEAVFSTAIGVQDIDVGYCNGQTQNPTYEMVCTGNTGHVEAAKISFNSDEITLKQILDLFFKRSARFNDPVKIFEEGMSVSKGRLHRTPGTRVAEKVRGPLWIAGPAVILQPGYAWQRVPGSNLCWFICNPARTCVHTPLNMPNHGIRCSLYLSECVRVQNIHRLAYQASYGISVVF